LIKIATKSQPKSLPTSLNKKAGASGVEDCMLSQNGRIKKHHDKNYDNEVKNSDCVGDATLFLK